MWQENMVLLSRSLHDAMMMVRAAGSGDVRDSKSARLARTEECFLSSLLQHMGFASSYTSGQSSRP